MKARLAAILVMVVLGLILYLTQPKHSSNNNTAQPTPTSQPQATQTPGAGLSADQVAGLASQMIGNFSNAQWVHITFSGSNVAGSLSLDVVTDGKGDLTGSYTGGGNPTLVVLTNHTLYMQGAAGIAEFLGVNVAAKNAGWQIIPSGFEPELLTTLANTSLLHDCLQQSEQVETDLGNVTVNHVNAKQLAPASNQPWEFEITDDSKAQLVGWQKIVGQHDEPTACVGGATDPGGRRSGTAGIFNFDNYGVSTKIASPANASPLPDPDPTAN